MTTRHVPIPIEHVLSDLLAAPFATEAAFTLNVRTLDPGMNGATGEFWRRIERGLLERTPGFDPDEAVCLRDEAWFADGGAGPRRLSALLRDVGVGMLTLVGPTYDPGLRTLVALADGTDARMARQAWRWLTFCLPEDLLVGAARDAAHHPATVEVCSRVLDRQLRERRFIESHLHLGASLSPGMLWIAALCTLARPATKEAHFAGPEAPFREGADFAAWLLRGAIARQLLAEFLAARRGPIAQVPSFHVFLQRRLFELASTDGHLAASSLETALGELTSGGLAAISPVSYQRLRPTYARLAGQAAHLPNLDSLDALAAADPIARFYPGTSPQRPAEVSFISDALAYLRMADDACFESLFWQVVRLRCLLYRDHVQRPRTQGLTWFMRFFERLTRVKNGVAHRAFIEAACLGGGPGLRALEFRTSPRDNRSQLDQFVRQMADMQGVGGTRPPSPYVGDTELGLILHFTRQRHAKRTAPPAFGAAAHADPSGPGNAGVRYRAYYRERRAETLAVAGALRQGGLALQYLRGLDACSDEVAIPIWVLAPLLRHLRTVAAEVAAATSGAVGQAIPGLELTLHAGESFPHVLGGLRRIDEALRLLRSGDRIGHGLALGWDVAEWARSTGRVSMAAEERLFDLIWESRLAAEGIATPPGRMDYVVAQIHTLTSDIFGEPMTPAESRDMVDHLWDEQFLRSAGFASGAPVDVGRFADRASRAAFLHLSDAEVYKRGQKVVKVTPAGDAAAMQLLRDALIAKVARRGVVIEINPSSNLLIGNAGDLAGHPVFRLSHLSKGAGLPAVRVTLGSDDPSTFAARLRSDYQHLLDAASRLCDSEHEAELWLDTLRATGLDVRFTVERRELLSPGSVPPLPPLDVPPPP